jgi:hypothetical protein
MIPNAFSLKGKDDGTSPCWIFLSTNEFYDVVIFAHCDGEKLDTENN